MVRRDWELGLFWNSFLKNNHWLDGLWKMASSFIALIDAEDESTKKQKILTQARAIFQARLDGRASAYELRQAGFLLTNCRQPNHKSVNMSCVSLPKQSQQATCGPCYCRGGLCHQSQKFAESRWYAAGCQGKRKTDRAGLCFIRSGKETLWSIYFHALAHQRKRLSCLFFWWYSVALAPSATRSALWCRQLVPKRLSGSSLQLSRWSVWQGFLLDRLWIHTMSGAAPLHVTDSDWWLGHPDLYRFFTMESRKSSASRIAVFYAG